MLFEKEALAQMFSCEFCEIFKNNFFTEQLWPTASENWIAELAFVQLVNYSLLQLYYYSSLGNRVFLAI